MSVFRFSWGVSIIPYVVWGRFCIDWGSISRHLFVFSSYLEIESHVENHRGLPNLFGTKGFVVVENHHDCSTMLVAEEMYLMY